MPAILAKSNVQPGSVVCRGGERQESALLDAETIEQRPAELPGWSGDTSSLRRTVTAPSFIAGIRLVDAVADAAEERREMAGQKPAQATPVGARRMPGVTHALVLVLIAADLVWAANLGEKGPWITLSQSATLTTIPIALATLVPIFGAIEGMALAGFRPHRLVAILAIVVFGVLAAPFAGIDSVQIAGSDPFPNPPGALGNALVAWAILWGAHLCAAIAVRGVSLRLGLFARPSSRASHLLTAGLAVLAVVLTVVILGA